MKYSMIKVPADGQVLAAPVSLFMGETTHCASGNRVPPSVAASIVVPLRSKPLPGNSTPAHLAVAAPGADDALGRDNATGPAVQAADDAKANDHQRPTGWLGDGLKGTCV